MLIVADDFLNAEEERKIALGAEYSDMHYEQFSYPGLSQVYDDNNVARIGEMTGEKFKSATVMYRYYAEKMKQVGYIHSDANVASYTGIVYLSEAKSYKCGLALWKHKATGLIAYPTVEQEKELGGTEIWKGFLADGFDESKWFMTHFVPMVPGRLVLFPGANWHSRYPYEQPTDKIEDARLIKVFFCRV